MPEPRGSLEVTVRLRDSGRPVEGAEVLFVSPRGVERVRTGPGGRARSSRPATDLHVFQGGFAQGVFGAPPAIEVVVPEREGPETSGATIRGHIRAGARASRARVVAVAPGARLEGWAQGSADPAGRGRPTHLPRLDGGAGDLAVVVGARATGLAAILYDQAGQPAGVATAALPSFEPGAVIDGVVLDSLPGPGSERAFDLPLPPELDGDRTLFARAATPQGSLRVPGGETRGSSLVFRCPTLECRFGVELRRRESLGDDRGVVVEARALRDLAASSAFLPSAGIFRRSGRTLRFARGGETALELSLSLRGLWKVLILDAREGVELPAPEGPDPLADPDPSRLAERTDLRLERSPLSTDQPAREAEAWSRRRWRPRARAGGGW